MKKFLFVLFFSCLLFSSAKAQDIVHPYFPMEVGESITYIQIPITGTWHEDTMALDIDARGDTTGQIVISFSRNPVLDTFVNYWHLPEVPPLPVFLSSSLQNSYGYYLYGKPGALIYVGELVNEFGQIIRPPEALLTMSPIAGENFTRMSRVYTDDAITIRIHWKYQTIAHYDTWGPFVDCWRTALWEYDSNHVYNYVFQHGVGIVDLWHGTVDAQGNVVGVEYWKVSP